MGCSRSAAHFYCDALVLARSTSGVHTIVYMRGFGQEVIDEAMLEACRLAVQHSTDRSSWTGAVLLGETGEVIGRGWNSLMPGFDADDPKNHERPRKYEITEHAERRALHDAVRRGRRVVDSTLVAAWIGCTDCDRAIAEMGVREIVRLPLNHTNDHWIENILVGDEILRHSGVIITEMSFEYLALPELLRNGKMVDPRLA